ncbi:MAG: hypothetical protein AB7Q97_27325 [Gammaproteobacteria bacterium]
MNTPSPAFDAAQALLRQAPLPADAEDQLAHLERQVRDDEREYFGDLWEAFIVAGGQFRDPSDAA